MIQEKDVLILRAGLTGLSAATVLGDRALVLEQNDRPGGLARTECFNGYWFDHTLKLLYFHDAKAEAFVRELLGDDLAACQPEAWVETAFGTVRFPFQMYLGGLKREMSVRCLRDLAEVKFRPAKNTPSNFEEMLLQTFGKSICEVFLFPYNRKLWKRPLNTLASSGFQWTITRPDFGKVLRGALFPNLEFRAYNSNGWYPRPPKNAPARGMEVLSRALAQRVVDLRLQHRVEAIDLDTRTISARNKGQTLHFRFLEACLATLPLPKLVSICKQVPEDLRKVCTGLRRNRVLSAALSIRGPRPVGRGHWRYYSDESLIFTRLIYVHEFDPYCAPSGGWGLLAEITEPAENPMGNSQEILSRVRADIQRAGALHKDCEVMDEHLLLIDPAYAVFTINNQKVIDQARTFLTDHGITPLGRYGRWEYSSMAQVIRDGVRWGEEMSARLSSRTRCGELEA